VHFQEYKSEEKKEQRKELSRERTVTGGSEARQVGKLKPTEFHGTSNEDPYE